MIGDFEAIVSVSFRGKKLEFLLNQETNPLIIKTQIVSNLQDELQMKPENIKLIHKGKVLKDEDYPNTGDFFTTLTKNAKKKGNAVVIRLMATGVSVSEVQDVEISRQNAPRIRDDLSKAGQREIEARQRLGQKMLLNAGTKEGKGIDSSKYGFGRIETLPMLPDQQKAKEILNSLANDPGILACMAKHKWNVGCLAELFPEGNVGESPVCVMGLNENKGMRILLRLRTDDLKGFRKIMSIRKVLFHELAHNVHSEHNGDFFQLMRQIEKECNEMDWTGGAGLSQMSLDGDNAYSGGTYRLGGGENERSSSQTINVRELAARAAEMRMTKEEEEIQNACGCGKMDHQSNDDSKSIVIESRSKTNYSEIEDEEMDEK